MPSLSRDEEVLLEQFRFRTGGDDVLVEEAIEREREYQARHCSAAEQRRMHSEAVRRMNRPAPVGYETIQGEHGPTEYPVYAPDHAARFQEGRFRAGVQHAAWLLRRARGTSQRPVHHARPPVRPRGAGRPRASAARRSRSSDSGDDSGPSSPGDPPSPTQRLTLVSTAVAS